MSCCEGLVFKWGDKDNGGYEHEPGECYPAGVTFERLKSKRNIKYATVVRMKVAGSLVGNLTRAEIKTKMQAMAVAYNTDYQDATFEYSDGSLTSHQMLNDDVNSLSGNKIIERSWDNQYDTELANTRSFTFTVEAIYIDVDASENNANRLQWDETATSIGDGGPTWRIYNNWGSTPIKEQISSSSSITWVQQGIIFSNYSYPLAPHGMTPAATLFPLADEHREQRQITLISPREYGHNNPSRPGAWNYTHYGTKYKYIFETVAGAELNAAVEGQNRTIIDGAKTLHLPVPNNPISLPQSYRPAMIPEGEQDPHSPNEG